MFTARYAAMPQCMSTTSKNRMMIAPHARSCAMPVKPAAAVSTVRHCTWPLISCAASLSQSNVAASRCCPGRLCGAARVSRGRSRSWLNTAVRSDDSRSAGKGQEASSSTAPAAASVAKKRGTAAKSIEADTAARGMACLAARLWAQYQGLGETEGEVHAALVQRGVACVASRIEKRRHGYVYWFFSIQGQPRLQGAEAVARALQLQPRPVRNLEAGMLHLAALLHRLYDPPSGTPPLEDEQAVLGWLQGQGVVCTSPGVVLESSTSRSRTQYSFRVPHHAKVLRTHEATAALGWTSKTRRDPAAGKAWVVQQLRTKYQGPWLDSVSGKSVDEVWGVLEGAHGVRFSCIAQWSTRDPDQIILAYVRVPGRSREVSVKQLAAHLGLTKQAVVQKPSQEEGLQHLAQYLMRYGYVAVQPTSGGSGVVAATDVPRDEAGWVGWLQGRGLVFLHLQYQGDSLVTWTSSFGQNGRFLSSRAVAAAALGLACAPKLPSSADQAHGLRMMAAQLAGKYEELCEGGMGDAATALRLLQQRFGVQCLVLYRDTPARHSVMGAYFIPAAHDAEARKQPPGSPPLPNSVPGGRLVGMPDEVAAALGLTPTLLRLAREQLVRLLRADYVWPGVSSDAEGLQQLEQEWGLRVHEKQSVARGSTPLHKVFFSLTDKQTQQQHDNLSGVAAVARAMGLQLKPGSTSRGQG